MGFIEKLLEIVTKIDMLGQSIKLRINKEVKSKTIFGGIMTDNSTFLDVLF